MQQLSTTRATALLLAVVMVTAGCGSGALRSVGSPTDQRPATETETATRMPSTTAAGAVPNAEPAGPDATPSISSTSTTTPTVAAVPGSGVEDIDLLLAGLDDALAELDQLLNQAAAAMAAEKGEIIP